MKTRSKVLIVGLSVLCLAIPLSSCGAKWAEVTDFLSGVYITTDGWEGVSFKYEYKSIDVYTFTIDDEEQTLEVPFSVTETSTYKLDKNGVETGCYTYKCSMDKVSGTRSVGYWIYESSEETEQSYYDGSTKISYRKDTISSETKTEIEKKTIYSTYNGGFAGETMEDAGDEIEDYVDTALANTSADLGVYTASVSGKSTSWTMKQNSNWTTTVTIKTDGKYAVNYLCVEDEYRDTDGSTSTEKFTYKKIGGGKVSKPSWVNSNHFDDLD